MSQQDLLNRVVETLDRAGVEYMVTGSLVSSLQGEPRATHDLDLVVDLRPGAIPALLAAFPAPDYYLDERAIREAIRTAGMFNLLALEEGDKVDFWLLGDHPFDQTRFARRQAESVLGMTLHVPRPEDTILQKLRWARATGNGERHLRDALRVYEVQGTALDADYLGDWAQRLDVTDLWQRIQREAEVL